MNKASYLSNNKRIKLSWPLMAILGTLMAITSLSTDIYLPAMPEMQRDLQGNVELTITGFLIGFAIAQLIWGPISDHIGRRKPLFIGMILFIIGSVGCSLSQTIEQIVLWRIFQALGACTGPMLARAIIRDLYAKVRAAQMLSTLTIIMAIAPIIGPLLGGQMIKFTTWHSIFWLLAVIGCLMLCSLTLLPETRLNSSSHQLSIKTTFVNYYLLLTNKQFMCYTLCVTFYYVAAFAYIAGSPFVYISYFQVAEQNYGWLFAVNIIGLIIVSFLNRQLVRSYSLSTLLCFATFIAMCAMLLLSILAYFDMANLISIVLLVLLFFAMNGIVAATSTAAALDGVPRIAGSASALIGSLQYGSGIISSLLLAHFGDKTPNTMIWIMTVFVILSALMATFVKFKSS